MPHFPIQSSDPALLARATRVAETFAQSYIREGIAGIAFLGALARGYFDEWADIDINLFKDSGADIPAPENYIQEQGFEIHCSMTDIAGEAQSPWDMAKRWAFSTHRIVYDPQGKLARLFAEKIPLQSDERRWLMIEGMTQSNWYIDTLPRLWIARGDLASAHAMFSDGITLFLQALFGLNNQLVPDVKWRTYAAARLPLLPPDFDKGLRSVLQVSELSEAEAERRRQAFMALWQSALPLVETEVGMPFDDFAKLV